MNIELEHEQEQILKDYVKDPRQVLCQLNFKRKFDKVPDDVKIMRRQAYMANLRALEWKMKDWTTMDATAEQFWDPITNKKTIKRALGKQIHVDSKRDPTLFNWI